MIKLYGSDNKEMMSLNSLQQEGCTLVIKGKIYGAMPLTVKLYPEDARAFLNMLTPKLVWFFITLPFRRAVNVSKPQK